MPWVSITNVKWCENEKESEIKRGRDGKETGNEKSKNRMSEHIQLSIAVIIHIWVEFLSYNTFDIGKYKAFHSTFIYQ